MAAGCIPSFAAAASPKQPALAIAKALDLLIDATRPRALVAAPSLTIAPRPGLIRIETVDAVARPAEPVPDVSPAFIQYSSGTTGAKKGVGITHDMLAWQLDSYAASIALAPSDKIVSWLPLYHDMGLITSYFLPLVKGVPLVAMSPFDWIKNPTSLLRAIARHRATLCWLPNFAYEVLARHAPAGETFDLSSIRMLVNCSEPVMARSHDIFLKRFAAAGVTEKALATCYAMAEATFAVTASRPGRPPHRAPAGGSNAHLISSGSPIDGAEVRITDDAGTVVGPGVLGRICLRLPSLFKGYIEGETLNTGSFADGWHQTGDVGLMENGELFVLGRQDDVIIVAGQNIFPQDIEAVINDDPDVVPGRNVAFGVRDDHAGTEAMVVMVEVRDLAAARASGLDRRLAARVNASIGVAPRQIALLQHMALVKSTSGKISRKLNRQAYLSAEKTPAAPAPTPKAAGDDIVQTIREAVLAVLLQRSPSPPNFSDSEPLFEFGLIDSLSFVDLALELEKRLGQPTPPEVMKNPVAYGTVVALAAAFRQMPPAAPASTASARVDARELRRDWCRMCQTPIRRRSSPAPTSCSRPRAATRRPAPTPTITVFASPSKADT
jgi:acyl-CoA synthetase (AMP-forming)/AMP-acid ligase II/acyl carrier protein